MNFDIVTIQYNHRSVVVGFIAQFLYEQQPVKIAIDEDADARRDARGHVSRCALDGPLEPAEVATVTPSLDHT